MQNPSAAVLSWLLLSALLLPAQSPLCAAPPNPDEKPAGATEPAPMSRAKQEAGRPVRRWPPAKAEWLDPGRESPNGTKYQTFTSKVLNGKEVSYLVYLPPGYDEQAGRYPVIYWLHGLGGNQRAGASFFVPRVDEAIREHSLPPAIVVLVNGMVNSFYCDWADGTKPVESVIIKDLIPHVDATYRTIARREGRLVQGYSMGGFGAAHLAFKNPDVFGAAAIDAGALILERALGGPALAPIFKGCFDDDLKRFRAEHPSTLVENNASQIRDKMQIRVGCGLDDNLLARNRDLHELLERLKIEHQYVTVPEVDHNGAAYYRKLGASGFDFHRKVFAALATSNEP